MGKIYKSKDNYKRKYINRNITKPLDIDIKIPRWKG